MLNTVHKIKGVYAAPWKVKKVATVLVFSMGLLPLVVLAQTSPLDAYLREIRENNPEIRRAKLLTQERELDVSLAAANRKVNVDFKSEYLVSAGGRRIAIPIGDLFNPTYATLNALTGSAQFPTDLENTNERFIPSNFHDTRVEARLPLIEPRINREIALREAQLEESRQGVATRENEIIRLAKEYYFGYLRAREGQRIIDSAELVLNEVLRVNRTLVANGKANRDAILRTQADLAGLRGQRAELERQALIARAALNRLRGVDLNATVSENYPIRDTSLLALGFPVLAEMARDDRPELKQLDAGLESLDRLVELRTAGGQPSLGISLTGGAQGFLGGDLSDHPYVIGGLGLTWNLYDGKKRQIQQQRDRVRGARLREQRQDLERAVELQSWEAWQRIRSSRIQMEAANRGARAAAESLRITAARYRNQTALLLEYLDARNQWTEKRLEENLARFRLLAAYADLESAVGRYQ